MSFSLAAGEALHIRGPNGAGKSSLIRILAGLLTPFAGQVSVSGAIGLLDERHALDPGHSLGKALEFWRRMDAAQNPVPAELGLETLLDVPVRYLSTGQRKRAGFAALLNRAAPVWLLDEPLSGLDNAAIAQVVSLIGQHVGAGGIALIASHQPLAIERLGTLAIEDYAPALEEFE